MTRSSLPQNQLTQVLGARDTYDSASDGTSNVTSDIDFDAAVTVASDALSDSAAEEEETQEKEKGHVTFVADPSVVTSSSSFTSLVGVCWYWYILPTNTPTVSPR